METLVRSVPDLTSNCGRVGKVKIATFFLCSFLVPVFAESASFASGKNTAQGKRLIFLDFFNESNDQNLQFLSNSFGEAINSAIKNKYLYQTVTPTIWRQYAAENKWQEKDFFDEKKIRQMGKDLGAEGVIYGQFTATKDTLKIHGKIFSVIDGEVIGEEQGRTELNSQMFTTINLVSAELAKKIKDLFVPSDRGALWRSAIFPGWGHFYKQRPPWGYFWSISGGTALAFTLTSATFFFVSYGQYKNASPQAYVNSVGGVGFYDEAAAQAEFNRLENKANQWGQLALIGLISVATIYVAALIHAYFISPDLGKLAPAANTALHKCRFDMQIVGAANQAILAYDFKF